MSYAGSGPTPPAQPSRQTDPCDQRFGALGWFVKIYYPRLNIIIIIIIITNTSPNAPTTRHVTKGPMLIVNTSSHN